MDPPDMDMQAIYDRLENLHPDNIDITSHFTAEELKDMPGIEQNRYKSIKLNYLVMLEFGKPLTNRDFQKEKIGYLKIRLQRVHVQNGNRNWSF